MTFYGDDTSELNAFETGQLDLMDAGQGGSMPPVSGWAAYEANPDWLITPTQGAALYHGMYYNLDDTTDGSGTVWHSWGCPFAHGNSACGIEIRQAFAHLIDRPRFVSDGPLQGGGVALADDVPANKADPFTSQTVASSLADQCSWDTLYLANGINSGYQGKYGTCLSAFNIAPDAGGFAAPGSPDFCAAVDHLIRATQLAPSLGLQRDPAAAVDAFGNHCGIDPASPGLPNIAAHPMRAKVRSTDPRLTMGQSMIVAMTQLFAGNSVNTIQIGSGGVLGQMVFFCCTGGRLTDDWEWYTFGYQDTNPYPTTLYSAFASSQASNICGGPTFIQPNNPTFVCIPAADGPLLNLATTLVQATLYSNTYAALNVLGSHTVDIPAYTFATRTSALRSVANPVNFVGLGYENLWNFYSAHKSNYNPVDPRFKFNAGGPADTIRWGQAGGDIVANLNPFFSQWVWEFNILGEIFDTPFAASPVSPTQVFCWMCNSFSTTPADANGNEHIIMDLKQNLHWQDGVPIDAYDIKFSALAQRDYAAVLANPLILDVNVLGPLKLDVTMQGVSIAHPLTFGSTLIMPRHLIQLAGDNTYGQGVGIPDPQWLDPSYDPIAHGTFIGSSEFECRSRFAADFGKLGTGCVTNSDLSRGGQAIASGGSMFLSLYDNRGQGGAGPFDQWFRLNNPNTGLVCIYPDDRQVPPLPNGTCPPGSFGPQPGWGQYQEFSWADRFENGHVTTQDLAAVAACFGHTSSGCADGAYWLKDFLHPGSSGVISSEVTVVASHLDDTLLAPFSWSGDQAQQPGTTLANVTPWIGNCAPYNVGALTSPCYP